jgi:hypothetical protein
MRAHKWDMEFFTLVVTHLPTRSFCAIVYSDSKVK